VKAVKQSLKTAKCFALIATEKKAIGRKWALALMAWYLCTISSTSKRNWELCKVSRTWGIITKGGHGSKDRAREGDDLLFWLGGVGYVGHATVIENTRAPIKAEEVPWSGGQERYGLVIPLKEITEFNQPITLKFTNRRQEVTNLDQSMFQRGFMPITNVLAESVIKLAKLN
jgi:hypothetical protein